MRICVRSRMPMMCPCTTTSSPAWSLRISCGSLIGNVTSCVATCSRLPVALDLAVGRDVGADPDACASDTGGAGSATGIDHALENELRDPAGAVRGNAHLQEAHVLGAGALRHALDVETGPVRHELPVDGREPIADVRPGV